MTDKNTAVLGFTGAPLDRASEKRDDSDWVRARRESSEARILPLWNGKPFLLGSEDGGATELGFMPPTIADGLGLATAQEVFLGLSGSTPYFARDISALTEPLGGALHGRGHFREARAAAPFLPSEHLAILGQAKALLGWHAVYGFCNRCGTATRSDASGYRRLCSACGAEHFPRTDPAVIMLVTDGDRCLLARNRRFASNAFYSTLAGFLEPGETIEEAVRREVFEEVGLRVGDVNYVATQPWPFPYSLMIGCHAQALGNDIAIDGEEIIEARWFARDIVLALLRGEEHDGIALPRPDAIAHHLIARWAQG